MKKVCAVMLTSAFFITIFAFNLYAEYTEKDSLSVYQRLLQGNFFMYDDWLSADSFIAAIAGSTSSYTSADSSYSVEPNYFQEFDYIPDVNVKLLERNHPQDHFSVYSEGPAYFSVKYCDSYANPPSQGCPLLLLTCPDNSTSTHVLQYDSTKDIYGISLNIPKGTYIYKYIATNAEYQKTKGIYELSGNWYVTSRPYNFVKHLPIDGIEVLPDDVNFSWTVKSDEANDILTYEFYIGTSSDKDQIEKYETSPLANATTFNINGLIHKREYFWYMKIFNKFGADMETELFTFYTGGMVERFFNAPNPFNPAKGMSTKFVFAMPEPGTAEIVIYSEYGDKVWESKTVETTVGGISKEITYNGKDNSGRILYNGTYLAVLTKKYAGKTKTEKCRILIIK